MMCEGSSAEDSDLKHFIPPQNRGNRKRHEDFLFSHLSFKDEGENVEENLPPILLFYTHFLKS